MTVSKIFIPTNVLILVIFSSCMQKGQLKLSDLDNREVIEGIRSKAVPISKLKHRGYGSKRILCDAMGQKPFSGWVLTEGRVSGVPSSGLIKYRQGKPHGYTVELQANSMKKLKLGAYADGEEKGAWTAWHDNGNKAAEGNYSDGKKMGLWKEWHDNGQASSEYNYEDGRIVGLANQWRRDGSLLEKGSYAKGLREGEWAFYPLNDQAGKGYYSKGRKQNGVFFNWGPNGGKLSKEQFKASRKEGKQSLWHKNGRKHHELSYAKGKVVSADSWKPDGSKCPATKISKGNGTLVYYNDSGSEAKRDTFKNGVKESKRGGGGLLMMLKLMNAGKKMEEAKKSEDPVKKIKAATELMNSIRDTSKEIKKLREENLKPTGEALQEEAPFAIKPGENFTIPDLNLTMIWVKPGTFMMGSPISEARRSKAETQHQVTLTQGFYLGKHEVTQAQWNRTMGSDPSEFKGAGLPVDRVSWEDAVKFTKKLTQMERKAGRVPEGMVYRLPTEAQWEYACRAGTITLYSWGDSISSKNASFERNRPKATTPVGKYPANPWGFFDMHGNVWEWCADRYGTYPIGSVTNPEGPASGSYRVKRGGSWLHNGTTLRSAKRSSNPPGTRHSNIGFRVAFLPNK